MLMTIIAIGGSILGATTVAGLLMVYQIRQSTDIGNSTRGIFAADTGIEWGLYQFLNPSGGASAPQMSNGSGYAVTCYDASGATMSCSADGVKTIRSVGTGGQVSRAFEVSL